MSTSNKTYQSYREQRRARLRLKSHEASSFNLFIRNALDALAGERIFNTHSNGSSIPASGRRQKSQKVAAHS